MKLAHGSGNGDEEQTALFVVGSADIIKGQIGRQLDHGIFLSALTPPLLALGVYQVYSVEFQPLGLVGGH